MKTYDIPVGKKFIYKGKKYQVIMGYCVQCAFIHNCTFYKLNEGILCCSYERSDKRDVIFEKVQ